MDDSKVFMFPDGGTRQTSSDVNSLLPLLMCNGGFGGGNWVWIIFLFFRNCLLSLFRFPHLLEVNQKQTLAMFSV